MYCIALLCCVVVSNVFVMARVKSQAKSTSERSAVRAQIANKQQKARKIQPSVSVIKKSHRFRPGTVALREIKKYQQQTKVFIPKLAFQRVVREIAQAFMHDIRFQRESIDALQEGTEMFMTELFHIAGLVSIHAERKGINVKDLTLALRVLKVDTSTATPIRVKPETKKTKEPKVASPMPTITELEEEPNAVLAETTDATNEISTPIETNA